MKQLEFDFNPDEISFSEARRKTKKKKDPRPQVSIRPRADGGVGFGFTGLERLQPMTGYIDRLTPGIFEKFGIKKLIFRVGDGYKLAKPGESAKWFHTREKAEQYEEFIGKVFLLEEDDSGMYLYITKEVEE